MTQRSFNVFLFVLLLGVILYTDIFAQDTHYWSNQYGTRADLLGGVVIGSVKDLSSVYYNPGAVAFSAEKSLIISTHAFDVTFINLQLPVLEGKGYDYFRTRVAPTIFAIRLTNPLDFTNNFVISYLEKEDDKKEVDLVNLPYSQFDNPPEIIQNLYNETHLYYNNSEHWIGLTFNYTYKKNLGIGFTVFGAYRSQNIKTRLVYQDVDSTGMASAVENRADFEISHVRLFGKFGIFYEQEEFSLGLTMILPSLPIYGWGSMLYLDSNINAIDDQPGYSTIVSVSQTSLKATYKYPYSIGCGGSYQLKNSKIHFSIEWFRKVPNYKMLDTNPVTNPADGQKVDFDIYTKANSVINYGFGLEHHFKKDVDIYFALRTDFATQAHTNYDLLNVSNYNKYYITSGSTFKAFEYYITLGISYGFGSSSSKSLFSKLFPNPIETDFNIEDEIDMHYNTVKLIIGFSF